MTPPQELKALTEALAELALDNVDKYGFQVPICLANDHADQRVIFAADAQDAPDDAPYDFVACKGSVLDQARKWVSEGKLRALAFGWDVTCRVEKDGGPVRTQAVEMLLDHEQGGGYKAYLTFHTQDGKAVPDELLYEALDEPFFPAPTKRPRKD
jgi:hypothetical protein